MRLRARSCLRLAAALCVAAVLVTAALRFVNRSSGTWSTPHKLRLALKEAESDNGERLELVERVCREHNLGVFREPAAGPPEFKLPPTPNYAVFYVDRAHNLSWCPVYKAGSSSWLYNLLLMSGRYDEARLEDERRNHQLSELARRVYPEIEYPEAQQALESSVKLLVVRHPFERLLSAYRDKLENVRVRAEHGSEHFYRKYGARIVRRYRPGGNATRTRDLLRPGTYYWPPEKPQPAGVEPTFAEFVRYLIDVDLLSYADDHWIPIYLYCTPCLVRYDVISKVETMERDQLFALGTIGATARPVWQHRTAPEAVAASELARRYFGQLTKTQVSQLHRKYLLDFELFGYSPRPYIDYATDDS